MAKIQKTENYSWTPISDLPDNWQSLCISELASLAKVWGEQHVQLKESNAVKDFNERLLREWSIETGIIERIYTIDRGITELLIEQGIDAALIPHGATDRPVSEIIKVLEDHREALEGIFAFVTSRRELSISYIRQLHQTITRSQDCVDGVDQFGNPIKMGLLRGEWKKLPNNPKRSNGSVHEYCPPLQVSNEMERLIAFYQSHDGVSPEVNAAWLHHRFTQIHPFQDGNGRVARALATIVFLQAGWFPLVISNNHRNEYIAALEEADNGDLKPLVVLFGQIAKRAFARALTLSEDVLSGEKVLTRVVESLVSVYQTRHQVEIEKYKRVEILADSLIEQANVLLDEVAGQMRENFSKIPSPPIIRTASNNENNDHYYTMQIISTAKGLGYWANTARRRNWVRLHLVNGQKTQVVFSFHYLGKANRGVMVCTGFIYFPETKREAWEAINDADTDAEDTQFGETHPICSDPFYFSYQDESRTDDLLQEFREWVSNSLSVGLAEWAQRL